MDETLFLNVDLDVEGKHGLGRIVAELSPFVIVLHGNEERFSLEAKHSPKTIDGTISALVRAIKKLSPAASRNWRKCTKRVFNIGIQVSQKPGGTSFLLSKKSLALVESVRGEIAITVYAALNSETGSQDV
jgi:hypothetical protein